MLSQKDEILNDIKNYYTKSPDYNGLPLSNLKNYNYGFLCELIDEEEISVLTDNEVPNPYIKGFEINISKETMKKYVGEKGSRAVLYPTKKSLKSVKKNQ